MLRQSKRHRKLLLAALALPLVGLQAADAQPASAETIGQGELTLVTVETPLVDPPTVVAEAPMMAEPIAIEQPVVQPTYEMPSYAPAPSYKSVNVNVKEKKAAALAGLKKAYGGVFYGNNFSYLNDPYYDGPRFFSDNFKNIETPLGTVSFGGESRYRYHNERNHRGRISGANGLGLSGNDDNFWLSRQRLYADWKLCDAVRVYGEVLDAQSHGEELGSRPIEVNDLDITNAFVDLKLFDNDYGKFSVRAGRQELLYGAQRTVSVLDWANTRRTFEGIRGLYQSGDTSLDAFWTRFVPVDPDGADEGDSDIQFFGTYLTQKNTSVGQVEAYYLGFDNDKAASDFSLSTVGGRVSGTTKNKMLYDFEGAYQFGDNATANSHSAGFFTAGIGRKIETDFLSPTVWFYYDYASGDDELPANRADGVADGGYNHLFPLAHKYNGFMDLFGRRNLHDLNVFTLTPLNKKVSMIVWYHYFALVESTTPYDVVMNPYESVASGGEAATSRDLGHEIDVAFNINLNARNNIFIGYSHFSGGDYYDSADNGPVNEDNDADFFYAQFQSRY